MRALTAAELLTVWERGLNQTPLERALALVAAACPESEGQSIAAWPIGRRDACLLQLREWMFGPQLANTAQCPHCGERVEWESRISDYLPSGEAPPSGETFDLNKAEYRVRFRLPSSRDMTELLAAPGEAALRGLLGRCILSARQGGRDCEAAGLPVAVLAELARQMEALDPLADIRVDLTCPRCGRGWNAQFDIIDFLWVEIQRWAEETLNTIHRLAAAYGWSEREILELSPARRQIYLGLIPS
jgi:hypothetical protein